jgi:hypothetical protein
MDEKSGMIAGESVTGDNELSGNIKTEEQDARSKLRERFLRSLQAIYNKPAQFHLHERTHVTAVFRATDINFETLIVSDLQTPIGPLAEASLRSTDVLNFEVNMNDTTK